MEDEPLKKIAIIVRAETAKTCVAKGCLNAFNRKKDSFARYQDCDVELAAFCTENGRSKDFYENIQNRIDKFKKIGVDVVHVSTCNRSRNPLYEEMIRLFSEHFEVVGYTHGPEKRIERKNNQK